MSGKVVQTNLGSKVKLDFTSERYKDWVRIFPRYENYKGEFQAKYDLRQLEDGSLECDCPAFRFDRVRPKSCAHVRNYRKEHGK